MATKYKVVPGALRKNASNVLRDLMSAGWSGVTLAHAIAALGGIATGYGISRATSPTHISDSAEDEIVLNALDSNIVAARRKLEAQKLALKEEAAAKRERKPYDLVLNG